MNKIKIIFVLSIAIYFALIIGNVYFLLILMKILEKEISVSKIIWKSALYELILYSIMIISLYIIPTLFNVLYYFFFYSLDGILTYFSHHSYITFHFFLK